VQRPLSIECRDASVPIDQDVNCAREPIRRFFDLNAGHRHAEPNGTERPACAFLSDLSAPEADVIQKHSKTKARPRLGYTYARLSERRKKPMCVCVTVTYCC
jgi:hypothetical protein